ncbi:erythromycin esterase family protein [Spirosoma sp. SC4-14]|uniref:erythromycin esterase family protein n=1 Tax=Spirosoma sp. SC4-14 TaxID=3128900 RepID=UPI0030D1819C
MTVNQRFTVNLICAMYNYINNARVTTICCFLSYCLLLIGCKSTTPDPLQDLSTDQIATVQALNNVIFPIQDANPSRDFTDLSPLDTLLAKAQLVGMGEGTHGTREFFQMKDRLFRYLVQKHGFQTIAFEANFGRSVIVNRFLHGQTSNLASATDAAKSMYFWTWSTDEVRELLQWMKEYNMTKSANQQLSFYGFDCQYADDEFPLIREFLSKVDPLSLPKADSLSSLYKLTANSSATDSIRQQYGQQIQSLYNSFVRNENKWASQGGQQDYEIARQAARILIQLQDLTSGDNCNYFIKRDKYMAENVQWMLTNMHIDKVSLWAHNYHISSLSNGSCNQPSMGGYLKNQLKDKYLTICTLFTNGTFTVRDASASNAPLTQLSAHTGDVKTSFNNLFGKVKYVNFGLNLNQGQLDPTIKSWLDTNSPLLEVGATFDQSKASQYYSVTALKGRFDILLHFRDTSPSQLLP